MLHLMKKIGKFNLHRLQNDLTSLRAYDLGFKEKINVDLRPGDAYITASAFTLLSHNFFVSFWTSLKNELIISLKHKLHF